MSLGLVLALGLAAPNPAAPAGSLPPASAPVAFEDLWTTHVQAEAAGDSATADRALQQIRRLRIERNIENEQEVGLGLVLKGLEKLDAGDRDAAEGAFQHAVAVAPGLPDSHFGLAAALRSKGPLGFFGSIGAGIKGALALFGTARGALHLADLISIAWLLFAFGLTWTVAVVLLIRKGGLLRHDIEEWLGPSQSRSAGIALLLTALLLPVATFQGWGWLPLAWLALLFVYLDRSEKAVACGMLVVALASGVVVSAFDTRLRTGSNPLYESALDALEGSPRAASLARLEKAAREDPGDRDLWYLLALGRKRSGSYEGAGEIYRAILASDGGDPYSRNNLAGIEFARGAFDSALARYKEGTTGDVREIAATSYYNLSLAYLQKFDYQAFNEAKSNADRLAPELVEGYERWKYDTGDYAVVDLSLTPRQVWDKFAGRAQGVAVRNVVRGAEATGRPQGGMATLLNRFTAACGVFLLVALVSARRRGRKAFTLRCAKCGTAFCRNCHLGTSASGLCSQCYHLFVVRDGVSGPARNRKLAEVQDAEAKRGRVFRLLSLVCPGAGHVYGGRTLVGVGLLALWWAPVALAAASRVLPVTDASSRLAPLWPWTFVVTVLALAWVLASRLRPEAEVSRPVRRPTVRRAKVA